MNIKAFLLRGCGCLVAFLWTVVLVAQCDQQQRELDYIALRALYLSTDGDNWINNSGWFTAAEFIANSTMPVDTDMGTWYGVTTNVDGCVTCIDLDGNPECDLSYTIQGNNLNGIIPPEVGSLNYLTDLSLNQNNLSGSIPPELGDLSNLTTLDLGNNQLSGGIPPELGNLDNVIYLFLYNNGLNGSIPSELGNLSNVYYISLSRNELSGSIPPELGNLSNMYRISLYNNQLSNGQKITSRFEGLKR